jgi:HAD superfamily hydrolase (TIGR01509 family)
MRQPGIIFDLDGTLVDSVYHHVRVWHDVLRKAGIVAAQWRIHGAIGMSGSLFLPKLLRDIGHAHSKSLVTRLQSAHARQFSTLIPHIEPLPGAGHLLKLLKRRNIPFAIATSGNAQHTNRLLRRVGGSECPVITSEDVAAAKPAPDLFELAAKRLGKEARDCFIVGDSIWDVLAGLRMNASVVGLLSGGFGGELLQRSGTYRVYADPLELSESLEQLGFPPG